MKIMTAELAERINKITKEFPDGTVVSDLIVYSDQRRKGPEAFTTSPSGWGDLWEDKLDTQQRTAITRGLSSLTKGWWEIGGQETMRRMCLGDLRDRPAEQLAGARNIGIDAVRFMQEAFRRSQPEE